MRSVPFDDLIDAFVEELHRTVRAFLLTKEQIESEREALKQEFKRAFSKYMPFCTPTASLASYQAKLQEAATAIAKECSEIKERAWQRREQRAKEFEDGVKAGRGEKSPKRTKL